MRVRAAATAMCLIAGGIAGGAAASGAAAVAAGPSPSGPVVVVAADEAAAARAVAGAGASVDVALPLSNAVAARVTPAQSARLEAEGLTVVADRSLRVNSTDFTPASGDTQLAATDPGSHWSLGSGTGVSVALIDTGVDPSPDLGARLVQGPDLSGEGTGLDSYGHGTFMAGLIAGDGTASADLATRHVGLAPSARIVSVKVAGADGTTSLSRVLEGIGWAVVHRDDLHIGVMNLSFGVAPLGPTVLDPLAGAVEAAWASGITVVASAGNGGPGQVTMPGADPWILTVGAADTHGTATTADDTLAPWSGQAVTSDGTPKPEVVAPGMHTVSLRAVGSTIDVQNPGARVDGAYFVGSGTSMATAIAAGA
ncbi:MAG TPA: S8 family serine peptidase, partial [Acidimicrobiales bacterium]